MKKSFVLDTNVILSDPNAMFSFEEHNVIIPITVIGEVDKFKKDNDENGRNARYFSRKVKELYKGTINDEPIILNNKGGCLTVFVSNYHLLSSEGKADDKILDVARITGSTLVTKDTNLWIQARALGIPVEDYENDKIKVDELYTGIGEVECSEKLIDTIYSQGYLELVDNNGVINILGEQIYGNVLYKNQCIILKSLTNSKHSALARYDDKNKLFVLIPNDQKILGLLPKNREQRFALDLLLNPDIKLVTLSGKAGTGKTLLAIAAALHGVMESKLYKKIIVTRPIISLGNKHQMGYLPGELAEKLAPWMQPIFDNVDFLMGEIKTSDAKKNTRKKKNQDLYDEKDIGHVTGSKELMSFGILELGSLEHIRGRSIPNQFIIIEEAQNTTPHEMKTIITRAGEGTKVVVIGDVEQIDTPYSDAMSNGLTYIAEKFKDQNIAAHLTLKRSERSELAEIAANIL